MFIQVTAYNQNGKLLGVTTQKTNKILGSNPEFAALRSYVDNDEYLAVIKHESKGFQFNSEDITKNYPAYGYELPGWKYNKKGYPAYGVPGGYGMGQIDNPFPSENDLWNWKNIINTGKNIYNTKKIIAEKYSKSINQNSDKNIDLITTYQLYNSGKLYWKVYDNKIGWERNHDLSIKNEYGIIVYNKYLDIIK